MAGTLTIGDVLALRSMAVTEPTSTPSAEECRLAGYFVGDGCCTLGANGSPNANVVCSDPEQGKDIRWCGEVLGFSVHQGGGVRRHGERWTYYLSKGVREWLRERGLAGKGTLDKTVPDWVAAADQKSVANFIGAYFACDGGIHKRGNDIAVEFYSTNRLLLEQVSSLLLRFGIYSRLRVRNYAPDFQAPRHTQYRLILRRSDNSIGRFAQMIPVFGKKATLLSQCNNRRSFDQPYIADEIVSIEAAGKLPCRCISVEGEESFLVRDIVVHNSGGKESAENTIRNNAGLRVSWDAISRLWRRPDNLRLTAGVRT